MGSVRYYTYIIDMYSNMNNVPMTEYVYALTFADRRCFFFFFLGAMSSLTSHHNNNSICIELCPKLHSHAVVVN